MNDIVETHPFLDLTPEAIRAARPDVMKFAVETPQIPLPGARSAQEIHLKLENLQVTGAFKIRPAAALLQAMPVRERRLGVYTASSGNFGIALARVAEELGVPCGVVVPTHSPSLKLEKLRAAGANVLEVPPDQWWETIRTRTHAGMAGVYVDAVSDVRAQAGSASIGLEIVERMPDVDTVLVPFGGGGLACGVSAALKSVNPDIRVLACESELSTPLTAAFAAGMPVSVPVRHGFVSGIGGNSVLPEMWQTVRRRVDDTIVVGLDDVAAAIRELALRAHVVVEGAGAVSVAAALTGKVQGRKLVCLVSGGNIGAADLVTVLRGGIPD